MNTLKLIKSYGCILGFVLSASIYASDYSFVNQIATLEWPQDQELCRQVEDVLFTLPFPGWNEPRYMLIPEFIQQWDKKREAVQYLLDHYQDPVTKGYLAIYYIKRLPETAWVDDGYRMMIQLLEQTKNDPEQDWTHKKAIEVILFRGSLNQILDMMDDSSDRSVILEFYEENSTPEILAGLTEFYKKVQNPEMKKLNDWSDLQNSISKIQSTLCYYDRKIDDLPKEYFLTEGKRQYDRLVKLIGNCISFNIWTPPDHADGVTLITKFWPLYRLGAFYLLEAGKVDDSFNQFLTCLLCSEDNEDTTSVLNRLFYGKHNLGDLSESIVTKIAACYANRISVVELNENCSKFLTSNMEDFFYQKLLLNFENKGNENSLPALKDAKLQWHDMGFTYKEKLIEKAIQSIEQRLGITPTVNPVHSSE